MSERELEMLLRDLSGRIHLRVASRGTGVLGTLTSEERLGRAFSHQPSEEWFSALALSQGRWGNLENTSIRVSYN